MLVVGVAVPVLIPMAVFQASKVYIVGKSFMAWVTRPLESTVVVDPVKMIPGVK